MVMGIGILEWPRNQERLFPSKPIMRLNSKKITTGRNAFYKLNSNHKWKRNGRKSDRPVAVDRRFFAARKIGRRAAKTSKAFLRCTFWVTIQNLSSKFQFVLNDATFCGISVSSSNVSHSPMSVESGRIIESPGTDFQTRQQIRSTS